MQSHRSSKNEDGKSSSHEHEPDQFAEMLGLKDLSVEKVMQNAKDDLVVEDMMA